VLYLKRPRVKISIVPMRWEGALQIQRLEEVGLWEVIAIARVDEQLGNYNSTCRKHVIPAQFNS
jgi:hypothetical protein